MYVNAHCLNIAYNDLAYRKILNSADVVYPDGISVVWSSRLLDGCQLQKITGADWIYEFCQLAEAEGLRIYLLAGMPGVVDKASQNLRQKFPRINIVGTCDGYFEAKSDSEVLTEITARSAQVVLIGMGTPAQEKWIAAHRGEIPFSICWAVGALFDYVAGIEPRVPGWMNTLALEWLWRLFIDPRGKWRRYILGNPLFVSRIIKQWREKSQK
jgi:N-acetylglucosaminyldiphosphoundecaprenol N-acetyl-beta-D-mannosaminyltransferase